MSIRLVIVSGPLSGNEYTFEQPETFLVGRGADCHCCLRGDRYVSRHHFLLDANPPAIVLRDLGSRNGTSVNGRKVGQPDSTDPAVAPELYLRHQDEVRVGGTTFRVEALGPAPCSRCGGSFGPEEQRSATWHHGRFICETCAEKQPITADRSGTSNMPTEEAPTEGSGVSSWASVSQDRTGLAHDVREFPGYELVRSILASTTSSTGAAFSYIYLARELETGRDVALKVLRARHSEIDRKAEERFLREMDLVMNLRHRNIVHFEARGRAGSDFYFVMEFCEEGSVEDLMTERDGRLGMEEAVSIVLEALDGLIYAHEENVIHRDLKPSNLLLVRHTLGITTRISDFGLAKNFQRAGLSNITISGDFSGSLPFAPREQIVSFKYSKPVTDVFGVGASLYNMLTGKYVYDFVGVSESEQIATVLSGNVVPIRDREVELPPRIAEVVDRAVDPDPGRRYQTAQQLKDALLRAT